MKMGKDVAHDICFLLTAVVCIEEKTNRNEIKSRRVWEYMRDEKLLKLFGHTFEEIQAIAYE